MCPTRSYAPCPPLEVHAARAAAERALTGPGPRPTALICDSDVLAAGAVKAVRKLGLRVPDDVSVTGMDDLALATAVEPELTTVRLPAERVGEHGMSALLAILDGREPENTVLPVSLVIRGSTAPPPPSETPAPERTGAPNRTGDSGHRKNRDALYSASPDDSSDSSSEGASVGVDAAPSASRRRAS